MPLNVQLRLAFGSTFVPVMVAVTLAPLPPSSTAVSVTAKEPSSSGTKLNVEPVTGAVEVPLPFFMLQL